MISLWLRKNKKENVKSLLKFPKTIIFECAKLGLQKQPEHWRWQPNQIQLLLGFENF